MENKTIEHMKKWFEKKLKKKMIKDVRTSDYFKDNQIKKHYDELKNDPHYQADMMIHRIRMKEKADS